MAGYVNDGDNCAYSGFMHENNLGIDQALYYPNLEMGRILSGDDVTKAGWQLIITGRSNSHIKRGGEKRAVRFYNNMPHVEFVTHRRNSRTHEPRVLEFEVEAEEQKEKFALGQPAGEEEDAAATRDYMPPPEADAEQQHRAAEADDPQQQKQLADQIA